MKSSPIAIVGMAGRFPGARSVAELWQNLRDGVESIHDRSDAELLAAGATSEELANPDYVKRASILDDVELFDAGFFGFSPRDASIMDPQHRHFLECAWEALEDAGRPPRRFAGSVGVFAGSGLNAYLIHNLLANRRLVETSGMFQLKQTGNDKDVLATRLSYQFDLRGPSVNVQTACSTSLVAVHLACQSLLNFECDMALAGGVTIEIPHGLGYVYREGEILSRDGRCRTFDRASSGTIFGSGLGIVVLRRLDEALSDGDFIHAVILGSAINNDGARKIGYLAPSVEGQVEVIAEALDFAGVNADDISYVETHGTGTLIGDPIEVRALTQAFRQSSSRCAYCGIGSLKTNLGHLDAAAGIAGLIKTVLALEHAQLPPSLHFTNLNPHIELERSPFFICGTLKAWPASGVPRRAGVTSLGIGGTNAHLVLEEAPTPSLARQPVPWHLLTISAKTEAATDRALDNLVARLDRDPSLDLADVAFTCQAGRHEFAHRRALVVENSQLAIAALSGTRAKQTISGVAAASPRVAFMFSGQGSQYPNMGRELYAHSPVFRAALHECSEGLKPHLGIDLVQALHPLESEMEAATVRLNETWLTQPALFSVEYALARWWMSLGIQPAAMVGHSIGEYVAACLAGVFSLEDALTIVAFRGRLIFGLPAGSMLAVPITPEELALDEELSVAAINNPHMCVISGPTPAIESLEARLARQSVACRLLHASHAFHSKMMDPAIGAFEERLRSVKLSPPRIPYLSNVTGTWIRTEEATDPAYWARHIRQTVRFSDNLAELYRTPGQILLEVGPGNALTSLARQQGGPSSKVFPSLPHPHESIPEFRCAIETVGQLWVAGKQMDWSALHEPGSVRRVPLPTYPFERQKYWIEPDRVPSPAKATPLAAQPEKEEDESVFFYRRDWKAAPLPIADISAPGPWLLFRDEFGIADQIAAQLKTTQQKVILVDRGDRYKQLKNDRYALRCAARSDYDALVADLIRAGAAPKRIIHLWSITNENPEPLLDETVNRSFFSPLYLAQSVAAQDLTDISVLIVSNSLEQVADERIHSPARALLHGPARVVPREIPGFLCKTVDLEIGAGTAKEYASLLLAESDVSATATVAWRGGKRFVETLVPYQLKAAVENRCVERGGVYLITGGLGALGLTVAAQLARDFQARLALVSRTGIPPATEWDSILRDATRSEAEKETIRKLAEIRSLAGGLLVSQADVTDRDQMRSAVNQVRAQFGIINGAFHAAGVLDEGPFALKTASSAFEVLNPKVRGTLVLDEVLRGEPLSCFVLFSSISSIRPPGGQVDYAAANAFLDAFAASRGRPVIAVNWGAWREIGMAARSASRHPWLEKPVLDRPDAKVYSSHLSEQRNWVLAEHRFKNGNAIMPGTGYLEMAAGAFLGRSPNAAIEFQDVAFLAPLLFPANESREIRVLLHDDRDAEITPGALRFGVYSHADDWIEHATGTISSRHPHPASTVDRKVIASRCRRREIVFDEQNRTRQESRFEFGPRWHSLKRLHIGNREALAELALAEEFSSDVDSLRLHPALLDMATGCSLYVTEGYEETDDIYLPFSYKKLCFYRPIPARFFSHIRARQENETHGEVERFDITLFDERNRVLAEIEEFTMRRVTDRSMAMEGVPATHESIPAAVKQAIESVFSPGISPADGARALIRILHASAPATIVAVSQPLDELDGRTPAPMHRAVSPPAPSSAAASEDIEATLAAWWREMLGVEDVHPDDDFFLLGGHSLVGVRLFAKIRNNYRVNLELATLFEARTVRLLAEVIRKSLRKDVAVEKKWPCIVPIQPTGSQIPLFLVHAIGGEVLFYEPLAKALGPDQPLYAVQSALANQADIKETAIEALAATYVREIRSFYPEGPYRIGGHSFGGIVAFEMAHQLAAQGAEPGILIMLDAVVPGSTKHIGRSAQISSLVANLRSEGPRYLFRKAYVKGLVLRKRLIRSVNLAARSVDQLLGRKLPPDLRYALMEEMHARALSRYAFKPYPGTVTVIRAVDRSYQGATSISELDDPTLGWGVLAQGLQVYEVNCDHMRMLAEPQVRDVAQELRSIISELHLSTIAS